MCNIRLDKGGEESYTKQKDRKKIILLPPTFLSSDFKHIRQISLF